MTISHFTSICFSQFWAKTLYVNSEFNAQGNALNIPFRKYKAEAIQNLVHLLTR